MKTLWMLRQMKRGLYLCILFLVAILLMIQPVNAQDYSSLSRQDFHQINESGFQDRQNSWSWTMLWWNGKVYAGTNRCWGCYTSAMHQRFPFWGELVPYPPKNPDRECAPTPEELPLEAEIWSYDPDMDQWERLFRSPTNVEIPDHPGVYTAYDIGFRTSTVFIEPDGTEALYVFGVTSHTLWPSTRPPRILRSTDGLTFEPLPQDPGTVLGDLNTEVYRCSFRSATVHDGRLFINVAGIHGSGRTLEAKDPALGNDNFWYITPPEIKSYCLASFNGYLYIGIEDRSGYQIVKTDTTFGPPYTLIPVVTSGGYLPEKQSKTPLVMHVFKNRLYVGMDRPAELIRINPDDTWDLVVGTPRETPDGWKFPLSGMDAGFNYKLNIHIWRIQSHEDTLYVGTADATQHFFGNIIILKRLFKPKMGFDLYGTRDGSNFYSITTDGFENRFNNGVRSWASTPYGLFLGTSNEWYGTEVWLGKKDSNVKALEWSENLEVETQDNAVLLYWKPPPGAIRFRIFRSKPIPSFEEILEESENPVLMLLGALLRQRLYDFAPDFLEGQNQDQAQGLKELLEQYMNMDTNWILNTYFNGFLHNLDDHIRDTSPTEIAVVNKPFFVDVMMKGNFCYDYYVVAEDTAGNLSESLNIVKAPSLAPVVGFGSLNNAVIEWADQSSKKLRNETNKILLELEKVREYLQMHNSKKVKNKLKKIRRIVNYNEHKIFTPWRIEDLNIMLKRLERRISLVKAGVLSPSDLD